MVAGEKGPENLPQSANQVAPILSIQELSGLSERLRASLSLRYERIKTKVEGMPFSKLLGINCVEFMQGFAHLEMPVTEELLNWNGTIHGGATATLIDTAAGGAIETLIDFQDELIATTTLHVSYIAPARIGQTLCAKASWAEAYRFNGYDLPHIDVPAGGKKLFYGEIKVVAKPERTQIALGNVIFVILGERLPK